MTVGGGEVRLCEGADKERDRDRDGFDAGVWPYAYNIIMQQNQQQHAAEAAALHFAAAANDVKVATQQFL